MEARLASLPFLVYRAVLESIFNNEFDLGRTVPVKFLSGKNQQQIVFAQEPNVVIFGEPIEGVDVGSAEDIHETILNLSGAAVLVISSCLPEVFRLADRILVTRAGRVVEDLDPAMTSPEDVMVPAIY